MYDFTDGWRHGGILCIGGHRGTIEGTIMFWNKMGEENNTVYTAFKYTSECNDAEVVIALWGENMKPRIWLMGRR